MWYFVGDKYYEKRFTHQITNFTNKIEKIGLTDDEINNLQSNYTINVSNNIEETNDLIITKSPSKYYVGGYYFFNMTQFPNILIKVILDGIFVKK